MESTIIYVLFYEKKIPKNPCELFLKSLTHITVHKREKFFVSDFEFFTIL